MKKKRVISYLKKSYLMISLIPLAVIVTAVLVVFNNHMMDIIHRSKVEQVTQVKVLVDKVLLNTENQAYVLLASSNLLDLKDVTEETKTDMDNLVLIYRLKREMENIQKMNEYIESILIRSQETDMLYTSSGYAGLLSEYNHLGWTEIDPSHLKWTFSYEKNAYSSVPQLNLLMRKATSPFLHQFIGEVIVNLNEHSLLSILNSYIFSDDINLTIVNNKGHILLGTNPDEELNYSKIIENWSSSGYYVNYQNYNIYYARSESGWYYVQTQKHRAFQFALTGLIPAILIILAFLVLFIIIASRFITSRVYSPLDDIMKKITFSEPSVEDGYEYDVIDDFINRIQDKNTELTDFLSHNRQAIKETLIKKIISGQPGGDDFDEQLVYIGFPRNKELYFAIILDLSFQPEETGLEVSMWPTWHQLILSLCESKNCEEYTCMGVSEDAERLILIAGTNDIDLALRLSNALITLIRSRIGKGIQLIHGRYFSALEDIFLSYQQAFDISNKKIFKNFDTLIFCDSLDNEIEDEKYGAYPLEYERKIISALKKGQSVESLEMFRGFIQGYGDEIHRNVLKSHCLFLVAQITRELGLWEFVVTTNVIDSLLNEDKYIERIIAWFEQFFTDIVENNQELDSQTEKYREVIDLCIRSHYRDPISLEYVADSVGLSYSYMRKIFTGIFGCGFAYYLNMLRIEEVKKLLETTDDSVELLAGKTGFTSISSFHRNFKSITGFTPSGYRRQIRENKIRSFSP